MEPCVSRFWQVKRGTFLRHGVVVVVVVEVVVVVVTLKCG